LQHRIRATRIIIVALAIALASIALVAAAIYYYYTVQVQVNVETPKVTWVTGGDIAASIGTNGTWCQITIGNLEPNATTVYTNALKFTVGTTSGSSGMALSHDSNRHQYNHLGDAILRFHPGSKQHKSDLGGWRQRDNRYN
jgi:hypothetical protein